MKKLSKEVRFIRGFQSIKSSKVCSKYGIDQSNLCKGQTTKENERLVMHGILREIIGLLVDIYLDEGIEVEDEKGKDSL